MSTNFQDVADKIRSRMNAIDLSAHGSGSDAVQVIYDNDLNEPPEGGDSKWIRFTVLDGTTEQADIGAGLNNTRFRTPGVAQAAIHVPLRKGDELAREIADSIGSGFRSVTVNGVTYRTPSLQVIGVQGRWYRVDVNIPFYFDFLD